MIVMSKGELVLTDTPRNVFRQADLMRSNSFRRLLFLLFFPQTKQMVVQLLLREQVVGQLKPSLRPPP